ncbi:hypothetical protein U1Q18_025958 [Sarracenia purpurea var. burkii]
MADPVTGFARNGEGGERFATSPKTQNNQRRRRAKPIKHLLKLDPTAVKRGIVLYIKCYYTHQVIIAGNQSSRSKGLLGNPERPPPSKPPKGEREKKGIRVWSSTSRQQPDPVSAKVGSAFGDTTRTNQEKRRKGIDVLGSKPSTQASVTGCGRPTESRNSAEQSRLTKSNFAPSGDAESLGRGGRATRPGADQELHQRPDWDLIRGPEVHPDPRLVRSTRDRRDRLEISEILNREIGIPSEGNGRPSSAGPTKEHVVKRESSESTKFLLNRPGTTNEQTRNQRANWGRGTWEVGTAE